MTAEQPEMELTPRAVGPATRRPAWMPIAVLVAIAAAIVVLIWVLVSNSQAFLEADIAVAERAEQGDKRFQLLGAPVADAESDDTVLVDGNEFTPFTVVFDDVLVDVLSQGTPPDLFAQGIPVVLEGHWVSETPPVGIAWPEGANDGWYFSTDRILVKHDNDYRQDRLDDAEDRGQVDAAVRE